MLVPEPGAFIHLSCCDTLHKLSACGILEAMNEKAIKGLQVLLVYYNITHLSLWRALPAPCYQLIQLFFDSSGDDIDSFIRQIFYKTCHTELHCFFPGALPEINTLHFSADSDGNGLKHSIIIQASLRFVQDSAGR